jgi:hypothetical protein
VHAAPPPEQIYLVSIGRGEGRFPPHRFKLQYNRELGLVGAYPEICREDLRNRLRQATPW